MTMWTPAVFDRLNRLATCTQCVPIFIFIFIFIFLIFSAFSHEKTGTRWFGGGAEEGHNSRKRKNRRPSGFPNNKAKTALVAKCPIIAFTNRIICNLTANLNRYTYRYNKLIYSINLLFLFVYTPRKSGFFYKVWSNTIIMFTKCSESSKWVKIYTKSRIFHEILSYTQLH
jgi:hypothetical protein